MPSTQFEFKLSNAAVGDLNVAESSVVGIKQGYTQMVLVDKSIL